MSEAHQAVPPVVPSAFITLHNDSAYGNPFASDCRFGSYTGWQFAGWLTKEFP